MFDPNKEKQRVYEMLSEAHVENKHFTKKELFKDSIHFALSEYKELATQYNIFFKSVDHLVIFNHELKDEVVKNTVNMLRELRFLIEKDYTKEELENMPTTVYDQVLQTQKKRADLLKKIAEVYLKDRVK